MPSQCLACPCTPELDLRESPSTAEHPTFHDQLTAKLQQPEMSVPPPSGGSRQNVECVTVTYPRVAQAPH